MKNEEIMRNVSSQAFVNEVCEIIERGRKQAYDAVNGSMIETYWKIGRRIVEEEQCGNERAEYGKHVIEHLSRELTMRYGKGFSKRYLAYFRKFYLTIDDLQILQTRLQNLTWSHILTALRVDTEVAIRWYLETASKEMWSVRTLDRNEQLFAAKYLPLLPTEEELRREIERQKEIFLLQRQNN
ncbi:MAG: DUF1016 domain-containing protein [Lentimicrobiaceae bacterium]|nr:DUF1016 domain-containing protein [Lentimicrobiaceae bacterium]